MCLSDKNLSRKQRARIVGEARRRGYFRVFKTVWKARYGIRKTGRFFGMPYISGKQQTQAPGWHVFLTYADAETWACGDPKEKVVTCYAKISWLNRLAYQDTIRAATFHTLVFPDWDLGDMTIREFRAACKK